MTEKNRLFDEEYEEIHPTAQAWISRKRAGQKATVRLWRKRDGLTFKPAKLYITFETSNGPETLHDDWDPEINFPLIKEGIPAENIANEAQRLSLMLRDWLSKLEQRFGPGYFESVLIEALREPEFSQAKSLSSLINKVSVNRPYMEGRSYTDCRRAIDGVLKEAADALTRDLKYVRGDAEQILFGALEQYLDERFHVTERKLLGWT